MSEPDTLLLMSFVLRLHYPLKIFQLKLQALVLD
jgi:hypothetical protein